MPTLNDTLDATMTDTVNDILNDTQTVTATPEKSSEIVKVVVVTKKKETKKASEKPAISETETLEKKFLRPPLEILTQDFEQFLLTLSIGNKPIQRLGYKCGKIIYGIPQSKEDGTKTKDLRVIAFKARKKSEKVEGKSRCIIYFGLTDHLSNADLKNYPGATSSKFGKCSVQSKSPVEVILDKVTFTDIFNKDVEKVFDVLKRLSTLTITQKSQSIIPVTETKPKTKKAVKS